MDIHLAALALLSYSLATAGSMFGAILIFSASDSSNGLVSAFNMKMATGLTTSEGNALAYILALMLERGEIFK